MAVFVSLRNVLWLGFFAVILAAWWVMFAMARDMGLNGFGQISGGMEMGATMVKPMDKAPMAMTAFGPLAAMWAIMMAAMMLPTLVPTLRAYGDLIRSADGTRAGWLGVVAGYFAVWVGFALVLAAVQVAAMKAGVLDAMGAARSTLVAGALLIAAGAFQFTRVKAICHGVCHAPMMYFLGHWRRGLAGGARMGVGLGAFCVGCCWAIMALGFAGGVMNLAWMGLATAFMVIEKLPQLATYVTRPAGVILILAGAGVCLSGTGVI